jgi:hypothetical protein
MSSLICKLVEEAGRGLKEPYEMNVVNFFQSCDLSRVPKTCYNPYKTKVRP